MNQLSFTEELFNWILLQPYWKQYLAANIFIEKKLSDDIIDNSCKYFLQEHSELLPKNWTVKM